MRERVRDFLQQHGTTAQNGFLPDTEPLKCLPHPYYAPWELLIGNLPSLISSRRIRSNIDSLPLLDTIFLESEPEWQRAYSILGFLTHAYIWGGDHPSEVSLRAFLPCTDLADRFGRDFPLRLHVLCSRSPTTLDSHRWRPMPLSTCGILQQRNPTLTLRTQKTSAPCIRVPAVKTKNGST